MLQPPRFRTRNPTHLSYRDNSWTTDAAIMLKGIEEVLTTAFVDVGFVLMFLFGRLYVNNTAYLYNFRLHVSLSLYVCLSICLSMFCIIFDCLYVYCITFDSANPFHLNPRCFHRCPLLVLHPSLGCKATTTPSLLLTLVVSLMVRCYSP